MSDRSAKLLLLVADSLRIAANAGAFRKPAGYSDVPINNGLAQEIRCWARGYVEHLAHVRERKEGVQLAKARAEAARDEMRDEEALARVREMAARKDADDFGCVMAAEALKLLEGDPK